MSIKAKLYKVAAALTALCLISSCSTKPNGPEVYLDDKNEEIVITLFAQGETISSLIQQCFNEIINTEQTKTFILYRDSANFYADEGLSYRELLLKRMESGEADDLYIIPAEDVLEFDRKGYIYDLAHMDFVHNLSEAALNQSTYDGKVFSLPLTYTAFGFLWNVDLLHQFGLEVPENLSEFLVVCETLKQNGIVPYGSNMDYGLSLLAMGAGLAPLYRGENPEQKLTQLTEGTLPISTYMRAGFTFLKMMIDNGYLDIEQALSTQPNSEEEKNRFRDGQCALISTICRGSAFSDDYPFEMVMTAMPILEEGAICVVGADQRLAVNPNSKHLDEALAAVEALGTVETLNEFARLQRKTSSARGNEAATLPQAAPLISSLTADEQIPNQDFSLHFNTWNTIKELCVKLGEGASVDAVCEEYDTLQLQEIATYPGQ